MGKTKNPCGVCKKGVTGRTGGIQCEGHCQQWFHPNCINVNSQEYVDLGNSSLIWICNTCGMHNIGMTSSIGNISSLHTDNSFDILGPDSEEENEDANKTSYRPKTTISAQLDKNRVASVPALLLKKLSFSKMFLHFYVMPRNIWTKVRIFSKASLNQ